MGKFRRLPGLKRPRLPWEGCCDHKQYICDTASNSFQNPTAVWARTWAETQEKKSLLTASDSNGWSRLSSPWLGLGRYRPTEAKRKAAKAAKFDTYFKRIKSIISFNHQFFGFCKALGYSQRFFRDFVLVSSRCPEMFWGPVKLAALYLQYIADISK